MSLQKTSQSYKKLQKLLNNIFIHNKVKYVKNSNIRNVKMERELFRMWISEE